MKLVEGADSLSNLHGSTRLAVTMLITISKPKQKRRSMDRIMLRLALRLSGCLSSVLAFFHAKTQSIRKERKEKILRTSRYFASLREKIGRIDSLGKEA
jgi:hypothetical protein